VEGGALVNLGKNERTFTSDELDKIKALDGVKKIGGFIRNQFPLTLVYLAVRKSRVGRCRQDRSFF
jgi:hypothetical protein